MAEGPAHPGGGDTDPLSPPPTAADDNSGTARAGAEVSTGPTGSLLAPRTPPSLPPQKSNPP